ncbi:MAG: hypothetical protein GY696_01480 [Gammaproteobacteria bacterium]|nr:hypothetical protein [Gammaproteobacteria bacterium]
MLERKPKPQEEARKVRSKEWIKKLQNLIDKDPTTSTRRLATEMNCAHTTIIKSIQQDLQSRSYRRQTGQFLSQALIDRRLMKCTKLLNMLKHPQEQEMIWFFSDEKNFCQDQFHNAQNNRWIAKSPHPKAKGKAKGMGKRKLARLDIPRVQRTKFPATVMVLGVVSSEGHVMPPHIFEKGLKINTEVYLDVLKKVVVPWCQQVAGDRPWVWQQDSAPAHMSKRTQAWLKDETNGIYSFVPYTHWPPSSPDCNPMDYFVWGFIETLTNRVAHNTKASLVVEIKRQFGLLPAALVKKACSRFRSRLVAVIEARGAFFE